MRIHNKFRSYEECYDLLVVITFKLKYIICIVTMIYEFVQWSCGAHSLLSLSFTPSVCLSLSLCLLRARTHKTIGRGWPLECLFNTFSMQMTRQTNAIAIDSQLKTGRAVTPSISAGDYQRSALAVTVCCLECYLRARHFISFYSIQIK